MTATSQTEIRRLPISALFLSQTPIQVERRAQFDQAALKELSATIKATGRVEQAITVRPVVGKAERFEIADGERRVLGSQMAGLAEILAEVRELTDEQVEQIQIVTGLQKEGLHELVEAEGYETLQKRGLSVEEIATKCGKTKATIYARMKLLALCPEARKELRAGKITASHALVIARIPIEKLQKEALKLALGDQFTDGPMSFRRFSEFVQTRYMLRLDQAPFRTSDHMLVPKAGACGACPKNTSCQAELFADVTTKALCTDPACFAEKKAAGMAKQIEAAAATGQQVISGKEAKKIATHGPHSIGAGYVRLDSCCSDDPKYRSFKQLLGKKAKPILLQVDDQLVEIIDKTDTLKQLHDDGVLKVTKASFNPTRSKAEKAANQKSKHEHAIEVEVERRTFLAVHAKAPKELPRATVKHLVDESLDIHGIVSDVMLTAWGWTDVPGEKELKALTNAQLNQLLFELTMYQEPGGFLATVKALKIDEKRIRKEVVAELKAAASAKASKKAAKK